MKPTYRRLVILAVAIVVIAGGYFGYRLFVASQRRVPAEFSEARSQGALASEKIISSSNDIAALVGKLSSPTSTPSQTSSTLGEVTTKVTEIRAQAIQLAATLETMTKSVENLRSSEAQDAALEAISQRLTLVSRLITYTDEVNKLVLAIRLRLEKHTQNSKEIEQLVKKINTEVAAVNDLSRQADEAMAKFDSLLR